MRRTAALIRRRSLIQSWNRWSTVRLIIAAVGAPGVACAQGPDASRDAYWQQEIHYIIEATLDEGRGVLHGLARITYVNRSPDTLDRLFFHQHLNAFRPNSAWARAERRRQLNFQELTDPEHGFERLLAARSEGTELPASYPAAPDSTILELVLIEPLAPGGRVTLELEWEARPSTICRRQCRRGRQYDFAQWYPRVAPYDHTGWAHHRLYPQGEFYGEFATYDVLLDVAEDQVLGATGAPVSGDPGWASTDDGTIVEQRDWYEVPDRLALGLLQSSETPGRKRVRFYAEDVHHFAWSTSPDYMHEGGEIAPRGDRTRPISIHVLYRPGDEGSWGDGRAVQSTIRALEFLEGVFGPYPWPQLTNLHRLEGGGTEFPMVIMDGSAGDGIIMHETAHQYAHGIFGNNEWKEAWLDEGFASFLSSWAFENGDQSGWRRTRERMARSESGGFTHPISTVSEDFPNFDLYGYMAYTRPSFMYHMLRSLVGGDDAFREILREYYARHALKHVTEADFRAVVADVSGLDLDWFFDQWLHTTGTLDYAIGDVRVEETDDGWTVRVEVLREGDAWMPVTLEARTGDEVLWTEVLRSRDRRQIVEATLRERPVEVILDPAGVVLDYDPGNDSREISES
jgi:hypothetical protein